MDLEKIRVIVQIGWGQAVKDRVLKPMHHLTSVPRAGNLASRSTPENFPWKNVSVNRRIKLGVSASNDNFAIRNVRTCWFRSKDMI